MYTIVSDLKLVYTVRVTILCAANHTYGFRTTKLKFNIIGTQIDIDVWRRTAFLININLVCRESQHARARIYNY